MSSRRLLQALIVFGTAGTATMWWMVRCHRGLWTVDVPVARWVSRHRSFKISGVSRVLTQLGSTPGAITVACLVAIVEYRRGLGNKVVSYFLVSIAGQAAMVNIAKFSLGRERPHFARLVRTASSSFPSGHTTAAATTFLCSALLLGRGRGITTRIALLLLAAVIAGTVAATRVMLGVHWVSDVTAGIGLGWAYSALVTLAFGVQLGLLKRPFQPTLPTNPSNA
jgi:membrane-associated phospholipid phosphatase